MFCRNCWANLPDGTQICPKCGADLSMAQPQGGVTKVPSPPPAPKASRLKGIAILTILLFSILGIGIWFMRPSARYDGPPPSTPVSDSVISDEVKETTGVIEPLNIPGENGVSSNKVTDEAVEALKRQDHEKAVELFRAALKGNPADQDIKNGLSFSLGRLGWKRFTSGDYSGARGDFEEALGYTSEPTLHRGMGFCLIKLGDDRGAIPHLETSLEAHPNDSETLRALHQAYIKVGDRERATLYLERLSHLEPFNRAIQHQLEEMKREGRVERGFTKKEGSHFLVRFDGKENADIGHLIAIILEEAYLKVGADIGYYPDGKVEAVLYTQEEFRDVTRSPAWVGALYDGRIKVPVGGVTSRTGLLERVLIHEYTHSIVHRLSNGRAPLWLNEGLAQYEEGERSGSPGRANVLRQVEEFVNRGNTIYLNRLEGSFMGLRGDAVVVAYMVSLSVTEYIINEFGISAVKRILEGLGNGKTLAEAIGATLYISYEDLNKNWLLNLKRRA